MMAYIIMHNLIVEDEQGLRLEPILDWRVREGQRCSKLSFCELHMGTRQIESMGSHFALRSDLIDHL